MKNKDATFTFKEFYEDLNRAFKAAQRHHNFPTQAETMEYAVNTPSSRFWVSAERLKEVIYKIESGKDYSKTILRKEMYDELYRRYLQCRNNPENKHLSKIDICYNIVYSTAPKFYITTTWALEKFYKGRKEFKNEK